MTKRLLLGLFLLIMGLGVASQYYNCRFSDMTSQEMGLAILAIVMIGTGAYYFLISLFDLMLRPMFRLMRACKKTDTV